MMHLYHYNQVNKKLYITYRKLQIMEEMSMQNKLAIGLALGLIFGTLIDNIALGLIIGVVFGSLPDSKDEKKK